MVTFVVAAVFIMIGDLNAIAPLISGFFMISYAFINFACFSASYANAPGWRPSFKFYNKWIAFITALLCICILFLLNVLSGAITLFVGLVLYKYIEVTYVTQQHWAAGSSLNAMQYNSAMKAVVAISHQVEHVKNYRPQFLVLTGSVRERKGLVQLSQLLRKSKGIFIYAEIILAKDTTDISNEELQKKHLEVQKLRFEGLASAPVTIRNGFYEAMLAESLRKGTLNLLQTAGIGRMRPNVMMMGWQKWMQKEPALVLDYVNSIRDAFSLNYGVFLAKNADALSLEVRDSLKSTRDHKQSRSEKKSAKQSGVVDVWWLADDGGLSILIPYLLTMHANYSACKIRIMCLGFNDDVHTVVEMRKLLSHLRIVAAVESVQVKTDVGGMVEDIKKEMLDLYFSFKHPSEESVRPPPPSPSKGSKVFDASDSAEPATAGKQRSLATDRRCSFVSPELGLYNTESDERNLELPSRTKRWLKISELICEKSTTSQMVFITMPVPNVKLGCMEYMRWLECLSSVHAEAPVCLLRGNQETVLSFDL